MEAAAPPFPIPSSRPSTSQSRDVSKETARCELRCKSMIMNQISFSLRRLARGGIGLELRWALPTARKPLQVPVGVSIVRASPYEIVLGNQECRGINPDVCAWPLSATRSDPGRRGRRRRVEEVLSPPRGTQKVGVGPTVNTVSVRRIIRSLPSSNVWAPSSCPSSAESTRSTSCSKTSPHLLAIRRCPQSTDLRSRPHGRTRY